VLGHLEGIFGSKDSNTLTVVNYHGTQKKFIANFESQVIYFKKHFDIISPSEIKDFFSASGAVSKRPLLLITFDDGIKNNLRAAEVLKRHQVSAYFFVVPDFASTEISKQKEYFIRHIRPQINAYIDAEEEDFNAMSWEDLAALIQQGHKIGSHTKTHRLVAAESDHNNSIQEIRESKKIIAEKLNIDVDSFCSINNTLESVGKKELELICGNYMHHFTTIPGPNRQGGNRYFIRRANVESHWLPGSVKYAIGKWDLQRWTASINKYTELLRSVPSSFQPPVHKQAK
jgi:hypothetical protein